MTFIPFNKPYLVGTETSYIEAAVDAGWLSAGGSFSARCQRWLEQQTGSPQALLSNSCTSALEASALLAGIGPGDEVVMPSFTFVTTASAFALRGATPVYVDIDPNTLNIDPDRVAEAISAQTKAIVPVHYAGVGADMNPLLELGERHGLFVIEDAAQGLMASYKGRALGSLGHMGALSFHETKNVTCGEGGALLVNDPRLRDQAEIVWEKGTDRRRFARGEVDKYSWVALGSSFGAGEVTAAFLWAQLERAGEITAKRLRVWRRYHEAFAELAAEGIARAPVVPEDRVHNAHMYYLLLANREARDRFIAALGRREIMSVFHYVPLHSSRAGSRIGRAAGDLTHTVELSERLVRLPLWAGMEDQMVQRVIDATLEILRAPAQSPV